MASSTSPAVPASVAEPRPSSKWIKSLVEFLIRRRILLSGLTFGLLIAYDVASGMRPHDLLDFRDPWSVTGGVLVLAGLALRSWAAGILRKNQELTTQGPYGLIRNPLYVGSFLMMLGFCALMGNVWNFVVVLLPMSVLYIVKVRQEERLLSGLFPVEWNAYARRTPRFVPRLAWPSFSGTWRVAQWMRSREYQALVATLVALVAIKLWQSMGA